MSNLWDLYVIEYARLRQPWVNLINGTYNDGDVNLPFSFVLATNEDRKVLIDTGHMQDEKSSGFWVAFGISDWISPVRMLSEIGVKPEEITDAVITHAHFDHMGAIAEFPSANIFIQKSELLTWYEAIALPKRFGYLTEFIDPENLRSALEASIEHRVTLIDGDKNNVLPGIHVLLGPGHTMGHQLVIVETARGRLVISGDCVYSRHQLASDNSKGVHVPLNSATGCIWDQLKTFDRVENEIGEHHSRLIVLHDSDRWEGLPVVKEVEGYKIVKAG